MALADMFNQIIVAFFVLLLGIILGKFAQRLTLRFMKELEVSYLFRKATHIKVSLDNFVSLVVAYVIYITALILALNALGILFWALIIISGLIVLAIILSLILYFISLFPNLWARFRLRKTKLEQGKILQVKNIKGKIKSIKLQFIFLDTGVDIPFYYLLKNKFKVS